MSSTASDESDFVDQWVQQRVFIRKGRYVGHLGLVIGFANGRFRVQIGDIFVNKQVSQLERYDPDRHSSVADAGLNASIRPVRSTLKTTPSLIGSRVRILNGKFGGYCGFVSKGGNGYFAVEIDGGLSNSSSSIVMKRSSELVILSNTSTHGEIVSVASSEDVQKAAVILLDLMQSEIGPKKTSCRPLESFETIEGY